MENKTVEMVVKDLLLADNRKKKKKTTFKFDSSFPCFRLDSVSMEIMFLPCIILVD